jgi:ABC-type sugar transport system substrate-binding protein
MKLFGKARPRLYLVTPVRSSQDFFEKVVDEYSTEAEGAGFDLVLKVPRGEYDVAHSTAIVNAICGKLTTNDTLVLIPARAKATYKTLENLYAADEMPAPVITFDLSMPVKDTSLPYVKGDDYKGGAGAAQAVRWYMQGNRESVPFVLVVPGLWGEERVKGFRETLDNGAAIVEVPECRWDVGDACRKVTAWIKEHAKQRLDVIFACNDQMALGARLAILEARRAGSTSCAKTRVVGFDGTEAFKYLLDCHDDVLLNSVDVNVRGQVHAAMDLLNRVGKHRDSAVGVPNSFVEVAPSGLVLNEHEQLDLVR